MPSTAIRRTVNHTLRAAVLGFCTLGMLAPANMALASPLSWLSGGEQIKGSGTITRQARELGHFNALALSMAGNVDVKLGNSESVTVEVDDNLQSQVETVIENGTLKIRPAKKNARLDYRALKIVVQARALDKISVGGSGSVNADRLRGERLQFDVGGSGSINASNLQSEAVTVSLGGSGNLKASGDTERLQVSIGGSGKVQTGQLAARDAVISIGGSGQATVWAKQSLNLSVAGSGDIAYYGDPQISRSIMGSGSIKRLGAAPQ